MGTFRLIAAFVAIAGSIAAAEERAVGSIYRFEWVGAFHPAIEVRVELLENEPGRLVASIKSDPPVVKTRSVSVQESTQFVRDLGSTGFWSLPGKSESPCPAGHVCTGCRDGATWTI